MYRIGEMSARAGVSTDTVRYYERIGLLPSIARSASGRRTYGDEDLGRLLFIRRAKLLGLSLDEVRSLLGSAEAGGCLTVRRDVRLMLREHVEQLDLQIAELQALRHDLEDRGRRLEDAPAGATGGCAAFPEDCACLPVRTDEIVVLTRRK